MLAGQEALCELRTGLHSAEFVRRGGRMARKPKKIMERGRVSRTQWVAVAVTVDGSPVSDPQFRKDTCGQVEIRKTNRSV